MLTLPDGKVREGLWKRNKYKGPGEGGKLSQVPIVEEKKETEVEDEESSYHSSQHKVDVVSTPHEDDSGNEAPAIEAEDDAQKIQLTKDSRLEKHMTDVGIGPDKEEEARIEAEQERVR